MEDSIQLPYSDQQNQQINFFVSPNNSLKKPKLHLINTGSQQSLAYSSQTLAKYQQIEKSPLNIKIPNFQSSQKPQDLRKMLKAGKSQIQKSPILTTTQSERIFTTNQDQLHTEGSYGHDHIKKQQRRKTVHKNQSVNLSRKYKELQYALNLEVFRSQQLRTKVSILSQILQQKLQSQQLNYFLKLNNSSKNLKNVDIFVELRQNQKKLKQAELIIDQQKQQIKSLKQQITLRSTNKQNINRSNCDPSRQIQILMEEKQILLNYIQEFKKQQNLKIRNNQQLVAQIQHYQQKQQRFTTIQRPKFILQINQCKSQIKSLNQQLEKIRMQKNLMELTYQSKIQELQKQKPESNKSKVPVSTISTMTTQTQKKQAASQTEYEDQQHEVLKAEVKILKMERDYYIQEFKKRLSESSQNYLLKLQLKAYTEGLKPESLLNK